MHANFCYTVYVACMCMTTLVMSSLKAVEEEDKMTPEQLAIKNVGKQVKEIFYSRLQNTVL